MVDSNHLYQPFNTHGSVNVYRDVKHPIRIVRDSGGSLSLILKSSVPGIENCYTTEEIFILDFHDRLAMPLAKIHLDCPLVKGEVIVGVCDHKSLPITDCDFLRSNDLVGGTVFAPLKIQDSPLTYNPTEELESQQPSLFLACAVTRSQARQHHRHKQPPLVGPLQLTLTSCSLIKYCQRHRGKAQHYQTFIQKSFPGTK